MTYQLDCTLPTDLLDHLTQGGLEALPEAMRLLLNTAMLLERQQFIGAAPYQRTAERQAQANGFKDKTLHTRLGTLTVAVPQVRQGGFYPQSLEKGVRSERALKLALAEMYVQGVSTRKVAAITEQLCGFEVSSTQVSRAAAELDAVLDAWRTRPLGEYPYVYLDARYEKVRQDGQVRDGAVLMPVASMLRASGQCWVSRWRSRNRRSTGARSCRACLSVGCAACSCSSVMRMVGSRQRGWQCLAGCRGSAASSTCSRTRRRMCHGRT